jgi:hypothetical protein
MSGERTIRKRAKRLGYSIRRYRGGLQVLDTESWIVLAEYLATLDSVERFLVDDEWNGLIAEEEGTRGVRLGTLPR